MDSVGDGSGLVSYWRSDNFLMSVDAALYFSVQGDHYKAINFRQYVQLHAKFLTQVWRLEAIRLARPQALSQLVARLKPKNPTQKNQMVQTAIYTSLPGLDHKLCQSPGVIPF
jgi:dipeptidase